MIDLIYASTESQKMILNKFKNAIFENASDYVHNERYQVEININNENDWWEFCTKTGLGSVSLGFQLRIRADGEQGRKFRKGVKVWLISIKGVNYEG